jgi:hypothetical protein
MKANLRAIAGLGLVLMLGLALQDEPSAAVSVALPSLGAAAPAPSALPVSGCRADCQDCRDCPTEIDIAPPAPPPVAYAPPPPRDDPIAREIERFGPPPIGPCERRQIVTRGRRATHDADACGIRCWYWRLRHGYCGPGCEYYRYRMYEYGRGRHPSYAC